MTAAKALFDLEILLNSRKGKLTLEEDKLITRWKIKALSDFLDGLIAGGAVAWVATRKLHSFLRLNISAGAGELLFSAGAGLFFGFHRFHNAIEASADNILGLEGTRMQRELATIMVKNYPNDHSVMQLISKHFYSEEVYDDSSPHPKLRWRYRNFFSDNISYDQRTDDDSQPDSRKASPTPSDSYNDLDSKKTDLRSKQIPVNSGTDLMADPLDCVFGHTATAEEIQPSETSTVPSKAQRRAHKRAQRRRRLRHQKGSLSSVEE